MDTLVYGVETKTTVATQHKLAILVASLLKR